MCIDAFWLYHLSPMYPFLGRRVDVCQRVASKAMLLKNPAPPQPLTVKSVTIPTPVATVVVAFTTTIVPTVIPDSTNSGWETKDPTFLTPGLTSNAIQQLTSPTNQTTSWRWWQPPQLWHSTLSQGRWDPSCWQLFPSLWRRTWLCRCQTFFWVDCCVICRSCFHRIKGGAAPNPAGPSYRLSDDAPLLLTVVSVFVTKGPIVPTADVCWGWLLCHLSFLFPQNWGGQHQNLPGPHTVSVTVGPLVPTVVSIFDVVPLQVDQNVTLGLAIVRLFLTKMSRFFLNLFTIPTWLIQFWFDSKIFKNCHIVRSLTMMDFYGNTTINRKNKTVVNAIVL
jgi:hypothetical protein